MKKFGIGEAVGFGWKTFKKNAWLLLLVTIVSGVVGYAPNALSDLDKQGRLELGFLGMVLIIVFWLLGQLIELGMVLINLKLVDDKKASFGDLFACTKVLVNGVVGSFVYGVIVLVGLICLVIPGIWLGVRLQFYKYLIVDRGMNPFSALAKSWKMTQGSVWNLVGLGVVLLAINILGVLALIVGVLVTMPLSMLSITHAYRKLSSEK